MDLKEVIKQDCKLWEEMSNKGKSLESYMYLQENKDSEETKMYQLILNGNELWYGTLKEINAVVKSMIKRLDKQDFLYD